MGDLLNETFLIYSRHLRRIIGLGAVLHAPVSFAGLILGNGAAAFFVEGALRFPASIFVYGAIVFAVGQQYVTGDIGIEKCYSRVWWRVVSLALLTLILSVSVIFGVGLFFLLVWRVVSLALLTLILSVSVIFGVGLFFLLVPLVLLLVYLVYWSVAIPTVMLEGSSSIEALRSSFRLVRHHWWRVFGISVVVGLVSLGLALVISVPFQVISWIAAPEAATTLSRAVEFLGKLAVVLVVPPVVAIAGTLLYYDLRVRKEGFDMPSLSREMGVVGV